ncbi:MAG: FAD:protein FMN transferase [Bryobacteraceae bacterium]|nr:FAD:protein FMN transferase [Bryobacteraceae bacterium]
MTRRSLLLSAAAYTRLEVSEPHMGTRVTIKLDTRDPARGEAAIGRAFARIHDLDLRLSNYQPESEANRFDARRVSADMRPPWELAERLRAETDGRFDVRRTALFDLWRAARKSGVLPAASAIARAQATDEGRVDLGGIAKGYAGDEALRVLRQNGETRALVAISGDLVAGDGQWRVLLEMVNRTVILRRRAASTSGDTEQYLLFDGQRYSHIVDPLTGLGLTNGVVASVVAPSGMLADALATVVCLLGVREGLRVARRYGAVVYI